MKIPFFKRRLELFEKVVNTLEINITTNSIESINEKLKVLSIGRISFSKAFEISVTFKVTYVSEYQFSVVKRNLNPRSLKTIQNNNTKIQI